MLKKFYLCVIVVVLVSSVMACSLGDKNESSKAGSDSPEQQLAMPDKGDTVATFHVKDYGDITVRFFKEAAPKAVENFVTHAKDGYYDGVIFHRVINDFMIQGGDPTGTGTSGESIWNKAFEDEFSDNLIPIRGALCMANAGANTNGSQFFIVQKKEAVLTQNQKENLSEEQNEKFRRYGGTPHLVGGHTVFGQVIEGMDVVDTIAATKVNSQDKPMKEVVIETIEVSNY